MIRIAALKNLDGTVEARITCDATDHAVVHFSARLSWESSVTGRASLSPASGPRVPAADLYRALLFHGHAFQKLDHYESIHALECRAHTWDGVERVLHGAYQPRRLLAGSLSTRDAVLHAAQACIPHRLVLPASVGRVEIGDLRSDEAYDIRAVQRRVGANSYWFDIDVCRTSGEVVERWKDVLYQHSEPERSAQRAIPRAAVAAFVERIVFEATGHVVRAGLGDRGANREEARQAAVNAAAGFSLPVVHRPDGAPVVSGHDVSISHAEGLSLGVLSPGATAGVGVDMQVAPAYDREEWEAILGSERRDTAHDLARWCGEPFEDAALRVWTATEATLKLGELHPPRRGGGSLTTDRSAASTTLSWSEDGMRVLTSLCRIQGFERTVAIAVALRERKLAKASPEMRGADVEVLSN
jgi:enediyne polyketide synthase